MNRLCHQPHPKRRTDVRDGVVARFRIGSERLWIPAFAGMTNSRQTAGNEPLVGPKV